MELSAGIHPPLAANSRLLVPLDNGMFVESLFIHEKYPL
jgi:hypothetical protein